MRATGSSYGPSKRFRPLVARSCPETQLEQQGLSGQPYTPARVFQKDLGAHDPGAQGCSHHACHDSRRLAWLHFCSLGTEGRHPLRAWETSGVSLGDFARTLSDCPTRAPWGPGPEAHSQGAVHRTSQSLFVDWQRPNLSRVWLRVWGRLFH